MSPLLIASNLPEICKKLYDPYLFCKFKLDLDNFCLFVCKTPLSFGIEILQIQIWIGLFLLVCKTPLPWNWNFANSNSKLHSFAGAGSNGLKNTDNDGLGPILHWKPNMFYVPTTGAAAISWEPDYSNKFRQNCQNYLARHKN